MFGARWDPERYARVLTACALEDDLAGFSAGDQTELGERGLNLSGGLLPTLSHPILPYPALPRAARGRIGLGYIVLSVFTLLAAELS